MSGLNSSFIITVLTTGSIFDPAATFIKKRIEIIDNETGERVHFLHTKNSVDEEKTDSEEGLAQTLEPEKVSYFFWSTTTPGTRWREHPFDISGITPNKKYTVRYRDHVVRSGSSVHNQRKKKSG